MITVSMVTYPVCTIIPLLCILHPVYSTSSTSLPDPDKEPSAVYRKQTFQDCPSADHHKRPVFTIEPEEWQTVGGRDVIVYSAFYEDRVHAEGPSIRIIAAGLQERFNTIGDMYCTLWYDEHDKPVLSGPARYKVIYPSTAHSDMWVSHFIICALPLGKQAPRTLKPPYAVSITSEPCEEPSNTLMILNTEQIPEEEKKEHAVCLQPLYNYFRNWSTIVEMFELQRLLKTEGVAIYTYTVIPDTQYTLNYYEQTDDPAFKVQVLNWTFPRVKSNVFCQRGAVNDCYYRMRNRYKYISVTDLDEVLIPRSVHTLPQLMDKVGDDRYGAYLFQHAYFRRNHTELVKHKNHLITQSSFWRTDKVTPEGKVRSKAMYHWNKAISLDLHSAYSLTWDGEEYILDPQDAMLHHYRAQPMESFYKNADNYQYVEDRYVTWMGEALNDAVSKQTIAVLEAQRKAKYNVKHQEL